MYIICDHAKTGNKPQLNSTFHIVSSHQRRRRLQQPVQRERDRVREQRRQRDGHRGVHGDHLQSGGEHLSGKWNEHQISGYTSPVQS